MAQDNSKKTALDRLLAAQSTAPKLPNPKPTPVPADIQYFANKNAPQQTSGGITDPAAYANYQQLVGLAPKQNPGVAEADNLGKQILDGGWNVVNGAIRLITGLGRGGANGVADAFSGLLKDTAGLAQKAKEGKASPLDYVTGLGGTLLNIPQNFTGGLARGVAGSLPIPGVKESVEKLTGKKVYEGYGEVLKQFGVDNPALGVGLDIALDPTTYLSLGLAGAAKGAAQGVRLSRKAKEALDVAAQKGTTITPEEVATFTPSRIYTPYIGAPERGNALTAAQGGKLSATRFILQNAKAGFLEAHKRSRLLYPGVRAAERVYPNAVKQAKDAEDLKYALDNAAQEDLTLVINRGQQAERATEAAQKGARTLSKDVQKNLKKIWEEYKGNPSARIQALNRLLEENAGKDLTKASGRMERVLEALTDKISGAARASVLQGAQKVGPAIAKTQKKWLDNPEGVLELSRFFERAIVTGEKVDLKDLSQQFSANDVKQIEQALKNPFGYRERGRRKLTEVGATEQNLTVGKRPMTSGDLRITQEAITGTKLARTTAEFKPSKEEMRVMSLLAAKAKEINKPGSALTPSKTLVGKKQLEEMFYRQYDDVSQIPASVLWARLNFLAEVSKTAPSDAYTAIQKYADKSFNPLTEVSEHAVPAQFPLGGKRTEAKPYYLSEIISAGQTLTGKNYSRETIQTLRQIGVRIFNIQKDGHIEMIDPKIVEDQLQAIYLANAKREGVARQKAYFKKLQQQIPELTEQNVASILPADQLEVLDSFIKNIPVLAQEKVTKILDEIANTSKDFTKAQQTLTQAGIEWDGRGSAFKLLADGRMAFRDFAISDASTLKIASKIFKETRVWPGKPVPIKSGEAFGKLYEAYRELATTSVDSTLRKAGTEIQKFLEPYVKPGAQETVLPVESVNRVLTEISNKIKKFEKEAANKSNAFYNTFFADESVRGDWIISAGIELYRASQKATSRDKGIFALIVDEQVQKTIRAKNLDITKMDKNSSEYKKLLELTFRDWYGDGRYWDGAGMSLHTALDLLRETSKQNRAALNPTDRAILERNLPAILERAKQNVRDFALKEDRIDFDGLPATEKENLEQVLIFGKEASSIPVRLGLSVEEVSNLEKNISKMQYTVAPGSELERGFEALMRQESFAMLLREKPDLAKALGSRKFDAKVRRALTDTNAESKALVKATPDVAAKVNETIRIKNKISRLFANQFNIWAKQTVENARAAKIVDKDWPEYATLPALKEAIKISGSQAIPNIIGRIWVAQTIATAGIGVRSMDKAAARLRTTTIDLAAERKRFTKILDDVEKKVANKTGLKPVAGNDPRLADIKPIDFFEGGAHADNEMLLIAKIRSFKVENTLESKNEWGLYLERLLAIEAVTGEFRNLKLVNAEALTAKVNEPQLRALAEVLAEAGDTTLLTKLEKGVKPKAATIQKALDQVLNGNSMTPEMLEELATVGRVTDELGIAGGKEIEAAMAELPPDQMMMEDISMLIESMLKMNKEAGKEYANIIASSATGSILDDFVMWRGGNIREVEGKFNRVFDTEAPKGKKGPEYKTQLRTLEPQAQYAASTIIYEGLEKIAKIRGLERGTPEYAVFMREEYETVENLVNAQTARYGIVPGITVKEMTGEAGVLNLYGKNIDELALTRPAAIKTVYLHTADIKQALPDAVAENLFYMGPLASLPETAVADATRLAVALRIEAGKDFGDDIAAGLGQTMYDVIKAEIQNSTWVGMKGEKKITVLDSNRSLIEDKISEFIANILEPRVLDSLVEAHLENVQFYLKNARGSVADFLGEKLTKLREVLLNPVTGSGDKIKAATEMFNELQKLNNLEGYSDAFKLLAQHDLHTTMVAQLGKDDISKVLAGFFKQKELEAEAAKGATKKNAKIAQKALKIDADHFDQALDAARVENYAKISGEGNLDAIMAYEENLNHMVSKGQAAYTQIHYGDGKFFWGGIKMLDRALGGMFFGYGAQAIKPLIWGAKRVTFGEVESFTNYVTALAVHMKELDPTRNLEALSFRIVQDMSDDLMERAATHHVAIADLLAGKRGPLSVDEQKLGSQVIDELSPILGKYGVSIDDKPVLEAITRMSQAVKTIFGGGANSLMARSGLSAKYLNSMLIEVGGGAGRLGFEFNKNIKDVEEYVAQWRGIKLFADETADGPLLKVSPLEFIRTVHDGLKHAETVPYAAIGLDKAIGVPRSLYASAEEALKDGLVPIKTADEIMPDNSNALIYFMDTDNMYYPANLVQEITKASKDFVQTAKIGKDWLMNTIRVTDPLQGWVKRNLTIFRPGNWNQNWMGGVWMNMMQGTVNPMQYKRAWEMLMGTRIDKKGLAAQNIKLEEIDAWYARYVKKAQDDGYVLKPADDMAEKTIKVKIDGKIVKYSMQDIWKLYESKGGAVTSHAIFDPIGDGTYESIKRMTKQQQRAIAPKLGRVSAGRDNLLRLPLVLDQLVKQGGKNLSEAMDNALRLANKAHPQPQDLTTFNQQYMKRLTMFFTWRAKTTGFLLSEILDRPGPYLAALRAQQGFMQSQGLETRVDNPRPTNVPLRQYAQDIANPMLATDQGLYSFTIANPFTDLFGAQGWLSGIDINSYEPIESQAIGATMDTINNVLLSSEPLIIGAMIDWTIKQQTQAGTKLTDPYALGPLLLEDIFSRTGLKPVYGLMNRAFPNTFTRDSFKDKAPTENDKTFWLDMINFASGFRISQMDKVQDVQKAFSEILIKMQKYAESKQK